MTVIWYAISFYVVGIAIVLYIRPEFMFQPGGMWKEFGLERSDHTVFPFWMFAILWAIFSYALATLLSLFFSSIVLNATGAPSTQTPSANANNAANFIQPISTAYETSFPATNFAASNATTATATMPPPQPPKVPGYYMLNTSVPEPRYVYYGPEPPTMSGGGMNRMWMPLA